jgi:PAS domain S-box-containing protein
MNEINEHTLEITVNNQGADEPNFYKFVIDSLPIATVTVDSELNITGFNPWAEEVTGYSEREVIGHFCGEILHGGMCELSCPLRTVLRRERSVVRVETTIQTKFDKTIPVRMNSAGLFDQNGRLIGGLEAFQDISYLKALEREKSNFISMIAHDMKSPLITIEGFSHRILNKWSDIKEEEKIRYLNIIEKEASKLRFLIDDFLDLSRLQTGNLKLSFGTTFLDKELHELFESYEHKASKSGIKIEFQSAEALPVIQADAKRLHQVFTNLLDNALKFSKEKGRVSIETQETDQHVVVSISDQGTGIDPEDLPYIFEPFHRGKGEEQSEGHGVGLAAVKTIVEGHGGRVLVESKLGKGSIFSVVLPKERKPQS